MGILVANFLGQANEGTQDSQYTGTWTISENFNGVIGETGRFDMRRLGLKNFKINPVEFNPAVLDVTTIRAHIVPYP